MNIAGIKPKYRNMSLSDISDYLNDRPSEFDFFNIETKCFYRTEGNSIKRFSKTLGKWILELNKESLDINDNLSPKSCFLILVLRGNQKIKTFNDLLLNTTDEV